MRVLISGASIAGPVTAYWLTRYGFDVTVVERAPELRQTLGHAVDLFTPSYDITEKMGLRDAVEKLATGTDRVRFVRADRPKPIEIDMTKVYGALSDRHVEIMRNDLSRVYYEATLRDVEYRFADSITAIGEDGTVSFERAPDERFDLVIGADGLHSNVRNLTFDKSQEHYLGACLAVFSVPKSLCENGVMDTHFDVGRLAGLYTAEPLDDGRAAFMWRTQPQPDVHYRDTAAQRRLVIEAFRGMTPAVDSWLARFDENTPLYYDTITQLRLDTWSKGRVTLVGDAGFCPGPAVGGSTSLAVVGAYVLAGELAKAKGDHAVAYPAYEAIMLDHVRLSRQIALNNGSSLVPRSKLALTVIPALARTLSALPTGIGRTIARLTQGRLRKYDQLTYPDYADLLVRA
ncbi:FAD-dependent oxidoreductase [Pseudonocardiaceae bacterium YIM PH 21723]|nr:FAD-dependent oxidoreductase [Pseudonocardiaceae bacterium YIM PH 21723]